MRTTTMNKLSILFSAVIAVGCSSPSTPTVATSSSPTPPPAPRPKADVSIGSESAGKTVNLKVGQTVEIDIPVVTDGGFHSEKPQLSPGDVLKLVDESSLRQGGASDQPMPGQSSDSLYTLKAESPGEVDCTVLIDNSADKVDPSLTFKVHFSVTKA